MLTPAIVREVHLLVYSPSWVVPLSPRGDSTVTELTTRLLGGIIRELVHRFAVLVHSLFFMGGPSITKG
ncbi:hypothetical protein J6590_085661 [Homalodisca vitripennis]|nr:hypothetical protein J6590_085661 [Homalodisca vitripennis]